MESLRIAVLLPAMALLCASCGGGGGGGSGESTTNEFPVDEPLAAALIARGVPSDIARYFAAGKRESDCATSTVCTYRQTYPNGATRDMTLSAVSGAFYVPTADELANASSFSSPVFDVTYVASGVDDVSTQIDLGFFVPTTSIPSGVAAKPQAALSTRAPDAALTRLATAAVAADGISIDWAESGKVGADVAIGSVLEHYKNVGGAKTVGTVYSVASAAASVATSLEVSVQTRAWLAELDALEYCAAHPTNPLAAKDPGYSAAAVDKVRAVRAEVKASSAVRFLAVMDETATGLHPVLAVLAIPLKQAYIWVEQTQVTVAESFMREARAAVVSCSSGYRATGGQGDSTYSGLICSLESPFEVIVTSGPGGATFFFTPSSGSAGTMTESGSYPGGIIWTGSGTYTVEGLETPTPRIVAPFTHVTTAPGISFSEEATALIDLTPAEDGACAPP
jgi:hypothetical protein